MDRGCWGGLTGPWSGGGVLGGGRERVLEVEAREESVQLAGG